MTVLMSSYHPYVCECIKLLKTTDTDENPVNEPEVVIGELMEYISNYDPTQRMCCSAGYEYYFLKAQNTIRFILNEMNLELYEEYRQDLKSYAEIL